MKYLSIVMFLVVVLMTSSCGTVQYSKQKYDKAKLKYATTITEEELKEMLYVYASDDFQGRRTGEPGQKKAVNYLKSYYIQQKIESPIEGYFQTVPKEYITRGDVQADSENVLAFIKGSEFPDEVVVISAHLDHIGIEEGQICNGADDDGSGTIAILEIAEAMKKAYQKGYKPRRSILFLHVTGEELGLWGSKYYSENPVFPLENTVANINIDMIGRVDEAHQDTPNYIYPIGSTMLSQDLDDILVAENNAIGNLTLDYKYNDVNDPNKFYYRSDHYNFAKHNIPVIFFFNGTHEDYHKPSDTPDKIDYPLLEKRTQLIFSVVWEVANRDKRIQLNLH